MINQNGTAKQTRVIIVDDICNQIDLKNRTYKHAFQKVSALA